MRCTLATTAALFWSVLSGCAPGELEEDTQEKRAACGVRVQTPAKEAPSASAIKHLVVILQENHSFDAYFGRYCTASGDPTCTTGRDCCQAAPGMASGCDADKEPLDDAKNGRTSPNNHASPWFHAMHWDGNRYLMDRFDCANVAYARVPDESFQTRVYPEIAEPDVAYPLRTYHNLAYQGALADRYFQPIIGASSSNDMFFARAGFVFQDNEVKPKVETSGGRHYLDTTIGDLLDDHDVPWAIYMEGFSKWCGGGTADYPHGYDPSDNPFHYYVRAQQKTADYQRFVEDVREQRLPAVSFVRGLGTRSEHPGSGTSIHDGELFVKEVIDAINRTSAREDTLILVTWDEGGGYFDHLSPPLTLADGTELPRTPLAFNESGDRSTASEMSDAREQRLLLPTSADDPEFYQASEELAGKQLYGTRVPLIALGPFAKKNHISHQVMEHSSILRFIEWNWLGDERIGTRDVHVNGIGDLLDDNATKVPVPR